MATLEQIGDAIETRLDTIIGLRVADYPAADLTPPFAWPAFTGWRPNAMGRQGQIIATFDIHVFTAQGLRTVDGYKALLGYADWSGPDSIWLALWDGNNIPAGTFGGLADTTLNVDTDQGFRLLGIEEVAAYEMFGGVFSVEVHTKG